LRIIILLVMTFSLGRVKLISPLTVAWPHC